jgi:hypothetical protein
MKTRIAMIAITAVMAIQFMAAGEPVKRFATEGQKVAYIKKNLLAALHSGNTGVVESSMRISAQLKMRYPEENISTLINSIDDVWQNHPVGKTRYKAFIAKSICENPEWYLSTATLTSAGDDTFFYIH